MGFMPKEESTNDPYRVPVWKREYQSCPDAFGQTITVGDRIFVCNGAYYNRSGVVLDVNVVDGLACVAARLDDFGVVVTAAKYVQFNKFPFLGGKA